MRQCVSTSLGEARVRCLGLPPAPGEGRGRYRVLRDFAAGVLGSLQLAGWWDLGWGCELRRASVCDGDCWRLYLHRASAKSPCRLSFGEMGNRSVRRVENGEFGNACTPSSNRGRHRVVGGWGFHPVRTRGHLYEFFREVLADGRQLLLHLRLPERDPRRHDQSL